MTGTSTNYSTWTNGALCMTHVASHADFVGSILQSYANVPPGRTSTRFLMDIWGVTLPDVPAPGAGWPSRRPRLPTVRCAFGGVRRPGKYGRVGYSALGTRWSSINEKIDIVFAHSNSYLPAFKPVEEMRHSFVATLVTARLSQF